MTIECFEKYAKHYSTFHLNPILSIQNSKLILTDNSEVWRIKAIDRPWIGHG